MFRDDGEDTREEKDLVRGYTFAEYHADVYDRTEEEVMLGILHFLEFTFQGHQSWTGLWVLGRWQNSAQGSWKIHQGDSKIKGGAVHLVIHFKPGLWLLHGVWEGKPSEKCGDFEEAISWLYNWLVWWRILIAFGIFVHLLCAYMPNRCLDVEFPVLYFLEMLLHIVYFFRGIGFGRFHVAK